VRGWQGVEAPRQVLAGELEAVEQQACAVDVELVGGDALDELSEGGVHLGAVARRGQAEAAAGAAGVWVGDGHSAGMVVVAMALAAQGGRAAAVAVVEEMRAVFYGHSCSPSPGGSPRVLFGLKF